MKDYRQITASGFTSLKDVELQREVLLKYGILYQTYVVPGEPVQFIYIINDFYVVMFNEFLVRGRLPIPNKTILMVFSDDDALNEYCETLDWAKDTSGDV